MVRKNQTAEQIAHELKVLAYHSQWVSKRALELAKQIEALPGARPTLKAINGGRTADLFKLAGGERS